jgi:hypothetical protein
MASLERKIVTREAEGGMTKAGEGMRKAEGGMRKAGEGMRKTREEWGRPPEG